MTTRFLEPMLVLSSLILINTSPVLAKSNCINYDPKLADSHEYVVEDGEYLSGILFDILGPNKEYCLYGWYGWVHANQIANPNLSNWKKLTGGTTIKILLPKGKAPKQKLIASTEPTPKQPAEPLEINEVPEEIVAETSDKIPVVSTFYPTKHHELGAVLGVAHLANSTLDPGYWVQAYAQNFWNKIGITTKVDFAASHSRSVSMITGFLAAGPAFRIEMGPIGSLLGEVKATYQTVNLTLVEPIDNKRRSYGNDFLGFKYGIAVVSKFKNYNIGITASRRNSFQNDHFEFTATRITLTHSIFPSWRRTRVSDTFLSYGIDHIRYVKSEVADTVEKERGIQVAGFSLGCGLTFQ